MISLIELLNLCCHYHKKELFFTCGILEKFMLMGHAPTQLGISITNFSNPAMFSVFSLNNTKNKSNKYFQQIIYDHLFGILSQTKLHMFEKYPLPFPLIMIIASFLIFNNMQQQRYTFTTVNETTL